MSHECGEDYLIVIYDERFASDKYALRMMYSIDNYD